MTTLTARYVDAVEVARIAHDGVTRKGTAIPYLAHVLAVSALVLEHGGDEDQAIAALLHDVAEDSGGRARLDEIRERFGGDVSDIVAACSDSLAEDPTAKRPWWDRKVAYIAHLADAPPHALLVSAADKLHNATAILNDYQRLGEALWSRFNDDSGRAGQLWYQRSVSEVISQRLTGPGGQDLAARLTKTVRALCDAVESSVGADQRRADEIRAERLAAEARTRG